MRIEVQRLNNEELKENHLIPWDSYLRWIRSLSLKCYSIRWKRCQWILSYAKFEAKSNDNNDLDVFLWRLIQLNFALHKELVIDAIEYIQILYVALLSMVDDMLKSFEDSNFTFGFWKLIYILLSLASLLLSISR